MELEVCIVAYEGEEIVERAVRSLKLLGSDIRLAIHDNSPAPLQLNNVRHLASDMNIPTRVERCGHNCGFARACNSLARSSTADLLLFLNPDAEVLEWSERPTRQVLPQGIVGPLVVDARNRTTITYGRARSVSEEFLLRWARWHPPLPKGSGYVSAAALLVPRRVFLRLDGFDESFFMYYEDVDFCLRANQIGVPVLVDPLWVVRHLGGFAAGRDSGTAMIRSYQSARHFYAKTGQNVALYQALCWVDAVLRLAVYSVLPSRRQSVQGVRRLLAHIAARPAKD